MRCDATIPPFSFSRGSGHARECVRVWCLRDETDAPDADGRPAARPGGVQCDAIRGYAMRRVASR